MIGLTSRGSTLKYFNLRNLLPIECLNTVIDIIREPDTKPSLVIKCIAVFQNLGIRLFMWAIIKQISYNLSHKTNQKSILCEQS